MYGIAQRYIITGIALIVGPLIYKFLNKRPSKFYITHPIDRQIPLIPVWVIPYSLYFPFMGISFVSLIYTTRWNEFMLSMVTATIPAWIIWYIWPTGVKRPTLRTKSTLYHRILHHYYTTDNDSNAVPSGHIFHSLICAYYLSLSFPQYTLLIVTIACIICISTLLTKQHYIWDVITGIIVAFLSIGSVTALGS